MRLYGNQLMFGSEKSKGKASHKGFKTTVALAKGYSKKMDVYYLCFGVFVFTFKSENNKNRIFKLYLRDGSGR